MSAALAAGRPGRSVQPAARVVGRLRLPANTVFVGALAAVKVLLTLSINFWYGWHRDELYFLDAARHLDWGYVDFPPVTAALARASLAVFGPSLLALRAWSALAGAGIVVLAALIARELGGGPRAQRWAAFAALVCPLFLASNWLFHVATLDQLTWAGATLVLVKVLQEDGKAAARWWIVLGLTFGLALETKTTVVVLGAAMVAGLLLTPARRQLATAWPWVAGMLALLLLLPNILWQMSHEWVSLRFIREHGQVIAAEDGRLGYILWQVLLAGLPLLPVMALGGYWLFRRPRFRALGWTAVLVEVALFLSGGKPYYPGPIYTLLLAAGAVSLEGSAMSRHATAAAVIASVPSLLLLPLGMPILPPDVLARAAPLWQTREELGDLYGWPEMADAFAQVYRTLPAQERSHAVILTGNYGEAGALNRYGPDLGLPPAYSGKLTYYYWGPPPGDPQVVLAVGLPQQALEEMFARVELAATLTNAYGVRNEEYGLGVFICRQPRRPLAEVWPRLQAMD